MASARPGRVGKTKGIPSPFVVLNLVMCGDGVDRWVLVDHGAQDAMEESAKGRQEYVTARVAAHAKAVERATDKGEELPRTPWSPTALPPMFTAMPTAEAVELLAENAPRAAAADATRVPSAR